MEEVLKSRERGQMTNAFVIMLQMIAERLGRKGKYANYTFLVDMKAFAMMNLVKSWRSFNPEKSNNPFAYFTSCINNSFLQYLNNERKHRNIRDALLVEHGLDPSYTFSENYSFEGVQMDSDDVVQQQFPTSAEQQADDAAPQPQPTSTETTISTEAADGDQQPVSVTNDQQ